MSAPATTPAPLDALGLRPLTARSLLLSLLLGSHPARLPARSLVRLGDLFGISEGTVRVALSRMASDGEVFASEGSYELTLRLRGRQQLLDAGQAPDLRPWRGRWEAVAVDPGAQTSARASAEAALAGARLACFGDGLWLRPANLRRPLPQEATGSCVVLEARPLDHGAALAARLWDLQGWAARAGILTDALRAEDRPAARFTVAAAIARHLRDDPCLPPSLLPSPWPGPSARRAYRRYAGELTRILASEQAGYSEGLEASARHRAT